MPVIHNYIEAVCRRLYAGGEAGWVEAHQCLSPLPLISGGGLPFIDSR
jgi:hypothetical protein